LVMAKRPAAPLQEKRLEGGERRALIALIAVATILRALAFLRYRFDSDEPQHLHVAWGWTVGLLQYRDLFDNHAPLFHIVTAPLLRTVGERPDVLFFMRAPMLVLFAIVVAATYVLGRRLYEHRVGIWSATLLTFFPVFFLKSIEYRTDNLWDALWMIALLILTGGPLTALRLFVFGLFLGAALATSLKTTLLLFTVVAAGAITYAFCFPRRSAAEAVRCAAAALLGVMAVPAAICAYFYARGGWSSLLYCVIEFNQMVVGVRSPLALWLPRIAYVPLLLILIRVAWRYRSNRATVAARFRFFFAVACAFFLITLCSFWILISPRDILPVLPLLAIFVVAAIERRSARPLFVYGAVAAVFCVAIVYYAEGFRNATLEDITMMRQVIGVTRPGEPLIDLKGETVFRPRPFYYILEYISRNALRRGQLADTIADDVVRARCHVAVGDGEFFPPRGRAFLAANFLNVGRLRAAGQWIRDDGSFSIAIPGTYVMVRHEGEAVGFLDGTPYRGARALSPGLHRFVRAGKNERVSCLWAPAFTRGYSPFHLRDRDF
jgi:Dolichyl-phosphate-mannose-protein mannosyltransferase